ncbi:MAG: putative ABC transporter, permease protein [Dehalococcoidia bacterium]|nr:MAG: putative ABC transporter, permease protein [Dehalococcoidia bacterium]
MEIVRSFRAQDRPVQILLINDLTIFLSFFMLFPYLATYLTDTLGFPAWLVGIILGLRVFCQQGLTILGGTLGDHLGYKPVIIAGLLLRTVGFLLFGITSSLPGVLLAAMLSGLAGALFSPTLRAYLAAETPSRRAEVFALDNVFSQTGTLVGPLVGVALLGFSFQLVCLSSAAVFFLLAIVQLVYLTPRGGGGQGVASVFESWREVFANRTFILYSLSMLGFFTLFNQIYIGLPLEVRRLTGSDHLVGAIFLISSTMTILGQIRVTRYIQRRWGEARPLPWGVLLMGLAFLPTLLGSLFLPVDGSGPVAAVVNVSPVLATTILLTGGLLIVRPFQMALIPLLAGDRLLGTYTGVFWMWSGIGATIGNTVSGLAFDAQRTAGLTALPWFLMVSLGTLSALAVGLVTRGERFAGAVSRGEAPAGAPTAPESREFRTTRRS